MGKLSIVVLLLVASFGTSLGQRKGIEGFEEGKTYERPKNVKGYPEKLKGFKEKEPETVPANERVRCGTKGTAAPEVEKLIAARQQVARTAALATPQTIKVTYINRYLIIKATNATEGFIPYNSFVNQTQILNDGIAGKLRGLRANLQDDGTTLTSIPFVFVLDKVVDSPVYDRTLFVMGTRSNAWNTLRRTTRLGNCSDLFAYTHVAKVSRGTLLGQAAFPWDCPTNLVNDGIFIDYRTLPGQLGLFAEASSGRTLIHEVGHWIGLYHVFNDFASTSCPSPRVTTNYDLVDDTPDTVMTNFVCPQTVPDTCSGPGSNPVRNFMDYSLETCTWKFTEKQGQRAVSSVAQYRFP